MPYTLRIGRLRLLFPTAKESGCGSVLALQSLQRCRVLLWLLGTSVNCLYGVRGLGTYFAKRQTQT